MGEDIPLGSVGKAWLEASRTLLQLIEWLTAD
jgi:hypothetical protein